MQKRSHPPSTSQLACAFHTRCTIPDVEVQQMSGLVLLQHAKTSCSSVDVIIVTGKPSENSGTLYPNGGRSVFRMPIDRYALLALLDSISSRAGGSGSLA
jgi:hypothetical protein